MVSQQHLSDEILSAYRNGTITTSESETTARHLETCAECQRRIGELSAGRSGTPGPTAALSGLAREVKAPQSTQPIPPELANLPGYSDIRELGKGGMGVVYLAKNTLMDRWEVLKVLNRQLLESTGAAERFLREIRSAAKLQHPNVVGAYSALQIGELLVFTMEYVKGDDLSRVVKTRGPFPITNSCYYATQVAHGLQHAFERGMVHRDIKPGNLILTKHNNKSFVKILDFGLAKATSEKAHDSALTGEGEMLGTPDYMAPEQSLDAAKADIRADIYSLGCTMYYLITGAPPFRGASLYDLLKKHHTEEAPMLNIVRSEVPIELATVVAKMMAKRPEQRYQLPKEVAEALAIFIKPGVKPSGTVKAEPRGFHPDMATLAPGSKLADAQMAADSAVRSSATPVAVLPGVGDHMNAWLDSVRPSASPVAAAPFPPTAVSPNSSPGLWESVTITGHSATVRPLMPASLIAAVPEVKMRPSRPWLMPLIGVVALFGVLGAGVAALFAGGVFDKKEGAKNVVTVAPTTRPAEKAIAVKTVVPDPAEKIAKAAKERDEKLSEQIKLASDPAAKDRDNAISGIASSLGDDEVKIRRKAAEWLSKLETHDQRALDGSQRAANDADEDVRRFSKIALTNQNDLLKAKKYDDLLAQVRKAIEGKSLSQLADYLRNPDVRIRIVTAQGLSKLSSETDVSTIVDSIKRAAANDSDGQVQSYCLTAITNYQKHVDLGMENKRQKLLNDLTQCLREATSGDASTRENALSALLRLLRDGDKIVRNKAADGLVKLEIEDENFIESIKAVAKNADADVQSNIQKAVEAYNVRIVNQLEPLIKKLKSSVVTDKRDAVDKLTAMGTKATPASQQVAELIVASDSSLQLKSAAKICFEKIDPKCYRHISSTPIDSASLNFLARMGPEAMGALPFLKSQYRKGNYTVLDTMIKIAPGDTVTVGYVIDLFRTPADPKLWNTKPERRAGLDRLDLIDLSTKEKVDILIKALDDNVSRVEVIGRLGKMGKEARLAVSALLVYKNSTNKGEKEAVERACENITRRE